MCADRHTITLKNSKVLFSGIRGWALGLCACLTSVLFLNSLQSFKILIFIFWVHICICGICVFMCMCTCRCVCVCFWRSEIKFRDLQSFSTFSFFLFFFFNILRKGLRNCELTDLAKLADQWVLGIHFSPFSWPQAPGLQINTAAMPAFYMGSGCPCQGWYVCSKHFDLWAVSLDPVVTFEESDHSFS